MKPSLPLAPLVLATGALASAQNYRLSAELPSDWLDVAGAFDVAGDQVAFTTYDRFSSAGRLWSVPADRSTAPLLLHDTTTQGDLFDPTVTPDGTWVVYRLFTTRTRLAAKRLDGSAAHYLSDRPVEEGHVLDFALSPDSSRAVYRADQEVDERFELYSRPVDGSGAVVRLNGALVSGGDVLAGYRISPDGAWVVYRADQETNEVVDLYAVPIDGSSPAVRLDTTRPLADVQDDFQISHDGLGVAYRADTDADEVFELFVTRIDGSIAPLKRNGALVAGGDVLDFEIAPGDARIVYRADQDANDVNELYGVPTFAGTPTKLNGALVAGGDVFDYDPSPDGTRVVFTALQDRNDAIELYVASPAGGPAPVKLHAALGSLSDVLEFAIAPDGSRVAYLARPHATAGFELYGVPIDASTLPVRLSSAFETSFEDIASFRFTADASRVVYSSDESDHQVAVGVYELYSVPADGSAAPLKLNQPIASGAPGHVEFRLAAGGARVVYRASQNIDTAQLWSVPVAGGAPIRLNDAFRRSTPGDVTGFELGPDGREAYYTTIRNPYSTGNYVHDLWRVALDEPRRAVRLSLTHTTGGGGIGSVQVSPDGRWVLYGYRRSSGTEDVYTVPSDGRREASRLNPAGTSGVLDAITPDSSLAVFHALGGALRSAPVDGSGPSLLLDAADVLFVRLTPDGSRVLYVKVRPARYELWSVPAAGGQAPVRLDDVSIPGGSLVHDGTTQATPFAITPDGSRAVYVADQDTDEVHELYSVPIDGSTPAVKVSGSLVAGGDVLVDPYLHPPFALTPDGAQVVYLADQDTDGVVELYRAPLAGGVPSTKVSGPLVAGGDVGGVLGTFVYAHDVFQISPDGSRVVYMADASTDDQVELYSVPLDGSAPPVRVSAPLAAGEDVADFGIAPGSSRVAYRVNRGTYDIFGAPVDGSAPAIRLDQLVLFAAGYGSDYGVHGFLFTPDGAEVLYCASGGAALELFHAPLDGSSPPGAINGPLVAGGNTLRYGGDPVYEVTPDGGRVVYIADQDRNDDHELFETFLERRPRRSGAPAVR